MKKVNENEIESILKHTNIYYNGSDFINEKHFYTADLDIFGAGSLFQLISRSGTSPGIYKLASWLNSPADKQTILQRQEAVQELAAKTRLEIKFSNPAYCLPINMPSNQIKNLVTYLKTTIEIKDEKFLWAYSQAAPFLLLTLIVLSIFFPTARYATGVVIAANYRLSSSRSKLVKMADLVAGKIGESLNLFSYSFECIEQEEWQSDYTKQLASRINIQDAKSNIGQNKRTFKTHQ